MIFSYSNVWEGCFALLKAHATVLAAIAGVFFLLPSLLVGYFIPEPQGGGSGAEAWRTMVEYFELNWHWLLLKSLVGMVGGISILRLLLQRGDPTVGSAIGSAFALLPFYFLAWLVGTLLLGISLLLLIVPGLYLIGRLVLIGPVVVAEDQRNPVRAVGRSFELTKDKGWAVFGLVFLVVVAALVVTLVISLVLGGIFLLIAGREIGGFLVLIVDAATGAALAVLLLALVAAIYRRLTTSDQQPG